MNARLVFLGPVATETDTPRLTTPVGLRVGETLPLILRHPARWSRTDVTRVIIGCNPEWADVVLQDDPLTIRSEHVRFYLRHAAPAESDLRAMKDCLISINGRPHPPLTWINLRGGEELQISCWRFRYEWSA